MFTRLGRLTVRRRRLVLALTVLFVLGAGSGGAGVFGALEDGGFDDPASESFRSGEFLENELGASEPEVVLLVSAGATASDVDDPTAPPIRAAPPAVRTGRVGSEAGLSGPPRG